MPGYTLCIASSTLDNAIGREPSKFDEFATSVNKIVANGMECLDWDNHDLVELDPTDHITPLFIVAGPIAVGYETQLGGTSAALVTIKAFAYPTRASSAEELKRMRPIPREAYRPDLVRPLEERLATIGREIKKLLGISVEGPNIEVEFLPQQKHEWVAV